MKRTLTAEEIEILDRASRLATDAIENGDLVMADSVMELACRIVGVLCCANVHHDKIAFSFVCIPDSEENAPSPEIVCNHPPIRA